MGRVLRASGKAVWTWPPVGAVDAGPMQIQLREGVSLRCAEAVLQSRSHNTACEGNWLGGKSIDEAVVEAAARKHLFGTAAER